MLRRIVLIVAVTANILAMRPSNAEAAAWDSKVTDPSPCARAGSYQVCVWAWLAWQRKDGDEWYVIGRIAGWSTSSDASVQSLRVGGQMNYLTLPVASDFEYVSIYNWNDTTVTKNRRDQEPLPESRCHAGTQGQGRVR